MRVGSTAECRSLISGGPRLASDGAGGAIVAWVDARCGIRLTYVRRIRASGEIAATLLGFFSASVESASSRLVRLP